MRQDITLNIPYDLSEQEWEKISTVYESMDGWLGDKNAPAWYGQEGNARYIWASVEPSGIQFCGEVETPVWIGWLTVLCARMSLALGREVTTPVLNGGRLSALRPERNAEELLRGARSTRWMHCIVT